MISDSIRKYRKENNMSQDELAENLGVSRQSISLWETGQTQPTIENIIALAKIFNVSTDEILENNGTPKVQKYRDPEKTKDAIMTVVIFIVVIAVVVCAAFAIMYLINRPKTEETKNNSVIIADKDKNASGGTASGNASSEAEKHETFANTSSAASVTSTPERAAGGNTSAVTSTTPEVSQFDLFSYCKDFAIKKGDLNGDHCIYQQPATRYGGCAGEYFSISYWADSNMVEFCLHCPLSDTQSINFYLRMRGGYNKKYEYLSSKYYRSNGNSFRSATGYIDPSVFSDSYPLSCDRYDGSSDGQNEFMEESRVGMCDLIRCLKQFVSVENMECGFSAFDFKNF